MLHQWFSFVGRLGRAGYNSLSLVAFVLILIAQFILILPLFYHLPEGPVTLSSIPLGWNAVVAGVIGGIALLVSVSSSVRRLHDLGWSGWWLVLCVAPLVEMAVVAGVGLLVVLSLLRGTRGPNEYGDKTPPNMIA